MILPTRSIPSRCLSRRSQRSAGLKGKVLSAMAHGVPTVLSPAAAEGIGALAGSHHLSAQSPEEWVSAIARLDGDEAL